uniref:Tudor domain-containing protein n=1 Tax=Emiliania huxleyi TaxID=2903 RepID=A0A7S3WTV9_EMIHU
MKLLRAVVSAVPLTLPAAARPHEAEVARLLSACSLLGGAGTPPAGGPLLAGCPTMAGSPFCDVVVTCTAMLHKWASSPQARWVAWLMCHPSRALALGHAAVRVRLEIAANPQLYVRVLEDSDASAALAAFDEIREMLAAVGLLSGGGGEAPRVFGGGGEGSAAAQLMCRVTKLGRGAAPERRAAHVAYLCIAASISCGATSEETVGADCSLGEAAARRGGEVRGYHSVDTTRGDSLACAPSRVVSQRGKGDFRTLFGLLSACPDIVVDLTIAIDPFKANGKPCFARRFTYSSANAKPLREWMYEVLGVQMRRAVLLGETEARMQSSHVLSAWTHGNSCICLGLETLMRVHSVRSVTSAPLPAPLIELASRLAIGRCSVSPSPRLLAALEGAPLDPAPAVRGVPLPLLAGLRVVVVYEESGVRVEYLGTLRRYDAAQGLLVHFDGYAAGEPDAECWVDEEGEDEWRWEGAAAAAAPEDGAEEEVTLLGSRSLEERNAIGFANAISVEEGGQLDGQAAQEAKEKEEKEEAPRSSRRARRKSSKALESVAAAEVAKENRSPSIGGGKRRCR